MQVESENEPVYDYKAGISELVQCGRISEGEAFFYDNHKLVEVFEQLFQSCQKNLSFICPGLDYGIEPARFFFYNENQVNATAYPKKNGYYSISINGATIESLYGTFCLTNALNDPALADYRRLNEFYEQPPYNISISYIMFQSASLFTYYHELGHLIQYSNNERNAHALQERYVTGRASFDGYRHILEYDADIHGAQEVARHVMEFYDRLPPEHRTYENLNKLITISLVGILGFYMMLLDEPGSRVYFYESTHPHPLIRIQWIFLSVLSRIQHYFPDLVPTDSIRETLRVLDVYFRHGNMGNIQQRFEKPLRDNINQIMKYIGEVIKVAESGQFPFLAINTVHKRQH